MKPIFCIIIISVFVYYSESHRKDLTTSKNIERYSRTRFLKNENLSSLSSDRFLWTMEQTSTEKSNAIAKNRGNDNFKLKRQNLLERKAKFKQQLETRKFKSIESRQNVITKIKKVDAKLRNLKKLRKINSRKIKTERRKIKAKNNNNNKTKTNSNKSRNKKSKVKDADILEITSAKNITKNNNILKENKKISNLVSKLNKNPEITIDNTTYTIFKMQLTTPKISIKNTDVINNVQNSEPTPDEQNKQTTNSIKLSTTQRNIAQKFEPTNKIAKSLSNDKNVITKKLSAVNIQKMNITVNTTELKSKNKTRNNSRNKTQKRRKAKENIILNTEGNSSRNEDNIESESITYLNLSKNEYNSSNENINQINDEIKNGIKSEDVTKLESKFNNGIQENKSNATQSFLNRKNVKESTKNINELKDQNATRLTRVFVNGTSRKNVKESVPKINELRHQNSTKLTRLFLNGTSEKNGQDSILNTKIKNILKPKNVTNLEEIFDNRTGNKDVQENMNKLKHQNTSKLTPVFVKETGNKNLEQIIKNRNDFKLLNTTKYEHLFVNKTEVEEIVKITNSEYTNESNEYSSSDNSRQITTPITTILHNKENIRHPNPTAAKKDKTNFNVFNISLIFKTGRQSINAKRHMCSLDNGGCHQICNKINGTCTCFDGFKLSNNEKNCTDIDECATENGGCEHKCINVFGYYKCQCSKGYKLSDDGHSCIDINECLLNNGHGLCQGTCSNTIGSYKCSCNRPGSRLSKDLHRCDDIDECKEGLAGCSHECINTQGSAFCTCPEGLLMGDDKKTCNDIDECQNEEINSKCTYGCKNTFGSYQCFMDKDILGDGISIPNEITCPILEPPKVGYFQCSRERSLKSSLVGYNGRKLEVNSPGSICKLFCPVEFHYLETASVVCTANGRWLGKNDASCPT